MNNHPHDEPWIRSQMSKIPAKWRKEAKRQYIEKFTCTFGEHSGRVDQVNKSRVAANNLLLDIVAKCNEV